VKASRPFWVREFLPRLEQAPGVVEILHGGSSDGRDVTTIIVWESPDDARRYREGALIKEPMALEEELESSSMREAFAVSQRLS
jgi:hypothetical protein